MAEKIVDVLHMKKGDEHYVYLFNDDTRKELLRRLGQDAANPQLSMSWYDAATLSKRVRETSPEAVPLPAPKPKSRI